MATQGRHRPWTWIELIDNGIGAGTTAFIAFVIPVILIIVLINRFGEWRDREYHWPYVCVSLLSVVFDGYCLWLLGRTINSKPTCFAVNMASRQRLLPIPLRPISAAYWLTHFLIGVVLTIVAEKKLIRENSAAYHEMLVGMFLAFGAAYAANYYLLLMLSALTRNPTLLRNTWRWRVLVDITVVVAAPFLFEKVVEAFNWIKYLT